MDSMALLRDLRFRLRPGVDPRGTQALTVAHFDHGMRPGSTADARWLAGVCRAWDLPIVVDGPKRTLRTEEEARIARYGFLESVRSRREATAILTAHHADDQAETVLFRILRGTGVHGLQGIPSRRGPVHRPLLTLTRERIESYVRRHGVPYRTDPTNRSSRFARNRIRHEVIPLLEVAGGPGVRRNLRRLARNARRAEVEREALESVAFRSLLRAPHPGRREWGVAEVAEWPEALRRRLLRSAARELGVSISSASTAVGVSAMASLGPGQGLDLSGGLRLSRGAVSWILARPPADVRDEVHLGRRRARRGTLRLGDRLFRYEWTAGALPEPSCGLTALELPGGISIHLRGWQRGDRIRLSYGSKAVSKLLAERGVPAVDRPFTPVVATADGAVLWVPGAAVADPRPTASESDAFVLRCFLESHD
jgi:tRNA(Ile)-lysidine synthase